MPVSLRTLADDLDLSVSTVARSLRGDPAIRAQTRARVLATAQAHGYRPSGAARALVSGRSQLIGLHLRSLQGFYVGMALRLERLAAMDGYSTILSTRETPPTPWRSDGEICLGHLTPAQETAFAGTPVVTIAPHPRVDYVAVDLQTPTVAAVRHLAASGLTAIAHLGPGVDSDGPCGDPLQREPRQAGYGATMADLGLTPCWIPAVDGSRAGGHAALQRHLATQRCPQALLCHNDENAIGAYRALREAGIRVPQQCALIGCDGIDDLHYLDCRITSIAQPLDAAARTLWAVLTARIRDPHLPQQRHVLPAALQLGDSTRIDP